MIRVAKVHIWCASVVLSLPGLKASKNQSIDQLIELSSCDYAWHVKTNRAASKHAVINDGRLRYAEDEILGDVL